MKAVALCTAAALLLAGCAHRARYNVYITGYTGGPPVAIAPGTTVAVVPNPRVTNPLLEQEVLAQVRARLASSGYPSAPLDEARVAVFVDYGAGSHPERRQTLTYTPGATIIIRDSTGKQVGTATASDTYGTRAETINTIDRWLTVTAVDAAACRAGRPVTPLWIGEARNSGADLDLRRMLGYLVLPATDRFGRNTAEARVTLSERDERLPSSSVP